MNRGIWSRDHTALTFASYSQRWSQAGAPRAGAAWEKTQRFKTTIGANPGRSGLAR